MRRLHRSAAALATASLAALGIAVSMTAVNAAPGDVHYVPVAQIAPVTDATYNEWHLDDPANAATPQTLEQAANGLLVAVGDRTLIRQGNGNDIAPVETSADGTSITDLANSLDVITSDDSEVFFQIPVFYAHDDTGENPSYTTLRQRADEGSDLWISSRALPGVPANTPTSLADIVVALGDTAEAIGAGFLVDRPSTPVLVSAFIANQETTYFYAQPEQYAGGTAGTEFVADEDIRPDEATYPGWHNSDQSGTYATVIVDGTATGLELTGKVHLLNGYEESDFLPNALGLAEQMSIDVVDGRVWAQIPVFFTPDGVIVEAPLFATIRAEVPASGNLADATAWVSSRNIPGPNGTVAVPANAEVSLAEIVAALGQHQVIAYGLATDGDDSVALVRSITFDNFTTNFFEEPVVEPTVDPTEDPSVDPTVDPTSDDPTSEDPTTDQSSDPSETGSSTAAAAPGETLPDTGTGNHAPTIAVALTLLLAGAVTILIRRRLRA